MATELGATSPMVTSGFDLAVERLAEHQWDRGSTPGAYRRTLPSWAHGQYRRDARIALAVAVEDGLILSGGDVLAARYVVERFTPNDPTEQAMRVRLLALLGHGEGAA